jgi:hypothetical protein
MNLISANNLPQTNADQTSLNSILDILFITVGAIAVLMIVIGGLKYIFAQGEPQKVAEAKNTMIYAFIGLILVGAAAAIVNFVVAKS